MKVWIGNFYPDPKMYREAEASTVGKSLVNSEASVDETLANRRGVKGHMNMLGLTAIRQVKAVIKRRLGIEPELVFSQKAGCGSCPCSPGFMIKIGNFTPDGGQNLRDLFGRQGVLNTDDAWGVREVGVHFWGEVKKGRVSLSTGAVKSSRDVTERALKAIRKNIGKV